MRASEILSILRLEVALDLRQRASWGGMLLYVVSAVYVSYLAVKGGLGVALWNALFWIILLFAAFNALSRSFQREDQGRQLYLHTLVHPRSVVMARTLYNAFTMVVLSLLSLLFYALFLGTAVLEGADLGQFLVAVVLGAIGFATVLTLIAAIAARAGNGLGLMAILGFPLVLPMLLAVMRASKLSLDGVAWSVTSTYFGGLLLLDVITVTLAWLLFPYLWRD
ncbi:MAG: heme exporter protein CcmB [Flavobacteriales bacterium]|nr:heme exporter protein CcmB [Flavobacteriales bacterium]MBK9515637.1 heme exporter protein CcmB [Flavobacteriales bacterium]MBP7450580.1 heme exporter protein CcmB [Flavobacteriales bacterium]HOZ39534.1 heme exporter protein CcmB [Flavobacteriales bacterium]